MTNPIPQVNYFARPVPPSGYGLLAAATVIETGEVSRELGGVQFWPYNCDDGGYGTYSTEMCDDGEPEEKLAGVRAAPEEFDPIVVWAASECATDQTEAEVMDRARHIRTLQEPLLIEAAFATRILADAGAPTVVPDFPSALAALEEFMGEQGYQGYIHAARRWATPATLYRWTNQTGAVLRSPLGHSYVFGGGYADVLGDTLVVTGQPVIWRSVPFEEVVTTGSHVTAALNNSVYAVSERIITVGYECPVFAVTITPEVP